MTPGGSCVPDADAFVRLAAPGVVVPVVLELDAAGLDPLDVFAVLAEESTHAALLETADSGAGNAEASIVAPSASAIFGGDGRTDVLDQVQAACAAQVVDIGVPLPSFVGGAIGMLAHEYVRRVEPTVPAASGAHPTSGPEALFLAVDEFLVFDRGRNTVRAIHGVRIPPAGSASAMAFDAAATYTRVTASLRDLAARVARIEPAAPDVEELSSGALATDDGGTTTPVRTNVTRAQFEAMVLDAREQVRSGECVQIVVSQRFDRPFAGSAVDAYRALRATSPAPYHVLLRVDALELVGASPEQLVGVDGRANGRIVTHPIAGTRRRGATDAEDARLAEELAADAKERAEHMMLVDLGRNDVGRVSVPGSVEVTRLAQIERYSHVMHLVSRVEGDLRPGLRPVDALRSCFPAGTLSGAPKVRALQHIARIEPDQRGPYGGVVGYVGHGGMLDMAITIRTISLARGMASVQTGAGVVAASDPAREYEESQEKAAAALEALQVADHVVARDRAAVGTEEVV